MISSKKCNCRRICRPPQFGIFGISRLNTLEPKQIPLKKLDFQIQSENGRYKLEINQEYKNDLKSALESEYIFPVDTDMALTRLEIEMENERIYCKIMEKEEASLKYSDAISSGNAAVQLNYDETQPDLVKLNIGNIPSGASLRVRVTLLQKLEIEDNLRGH